MKLVVTHLLLCFSLTALIETTQSLTCQEHAFVLDLPKDTKPAQKVDSALALMKSNCLDFLMSSRSKMEPADRVLNARTFYGHIKNRLGDPQTINLAEIEKDDVLKILYKSTMQSLTGFMETRDPTTLKELAVCADKNKEISSTLLNQTQTIDVLKDLEGKEQTEVIGKDSSPPSPSLLSITLDVFKKNQEPVNKAIDVEHTSLNIAKTGVVKTPREIPSLVQEEILDTKAISKLSEDLKSSDKVSKASTILAECETRDWSQIDDSEKNGKEKMSVLNAQGEKRYIDCNQAKGCDFLDEKNPKKLSELSPECVRRIPLKIFKSLISTPKQASELPIQTFIKLDKQKFEYLFQNDLLVSVDEKGTLLPSYVSAAHFAKLPVRLCMEMDNEEVLARMTQLHQISPDCMAALPYNGWMIVVSTLSTQSPKIKLRAGSLAKVELDYDEEELVWLEMALEYLSRAKLEPAEWQSIGSQVEGFYEDLDPEILEMIPDWAQNLSEQAFKDNPFLLLAVPTDSDRALYRRNISSVLESSDAKDGMLDKQLVKLVVNYGTEEQIKKLLSFDCDGPKEHVEQLPNGVFALYLEKCGVKVPLGKATDGQLMHVVSSCKFDEFFVINMGNKFPFASLTETCLKKLGETIIGYMDEEVQKAILSQLSKQQTSHISQQVICDNIDSINKEFRDELKRELCNLEE